MSFHDVLERLWSGLPVLGEVGGLTVRDLAPLVDSEHAWWIGDLSNAAWGPLAPCGWEAALAEGGAMKDEVGKLRTEWVVAFGDAVGRLAAEGSYAGPEGSRERWAAWIALEFVNRSAWV